MIKTIARGSYKLYETPQQTKILVIGETAYVWIYLPGIGNILESSKRKHVADHMLACGTYRIYGVNDELGLTDMQHLELFLGERCWQGYLLLSGLPKLGHRRTKMVATKELISTRRQDAITNA